LVVEAEERLLAVRVEGLAVIDEEQRAIGDAGRHGVSGRDESPAGRERAQQVAAAGAGRTPEVHEAGLAVAPVEPMGERDDFRVVAGDEVLEGRRRPPVEVEGQLPHQIHRGWQGPVPAGTRMARTRLYRDTP